MTFKIGDMVRIKSKEQIKEVLDKHPEWETPHWGSTMSAFCNCVAIIYNSRIDSYRTERIFLKIPDGQKIIYDDSRNTLEDYYWLEDWLAPVSKLNWEEI